MTGPAEAVVGPEHRTPSPLAPWRLYRRLPSALRGRIERITLLHRLKVSTVAVRATRVLQLVDALEARGIEVWLAGGWGIDALVGRQTRWHHDVDLVVRAADAEAAAGCLDSLGFAFYEERDVPEARLSTSLVFRDAIGRHVDLHPVLLDGPASAGGSAAQLGSESLGSGSLLGRRVGCLTAATQVALHCGYEPRERDVLDLALLEAVTGSPRS